MPPDYIIFRCRHNLQEKLKRQGLELSPADIRTAGPELDAHLAIPLFRPAKERGADAVELAEKVAHALDLSGTPFASVRAVKGYVNLKIAPAELAAGVWSDYAADPARYGGFSLGAGRTIVIDYSSPNIAKPFSVGHLRSTVIGQALKNILTHLGYRVIGDNHLGDWGTQFGKLLCAFELWGDESELARRPTLYLLDLYVRFHQAAKQDRSLEARARDWFRRLEQGDPKARALWARFVNFSRAEFERIYQLLGVEFDTTLGESFYADRLGPLVERALKLGIAHRERVPREGQIPDEEVDEEETVVLIPLDACGISTPLILQKSDGTSLYATRELATLEYRLETYHPEKILYVVGNEQEFYFKQFNAALKMFGITTPCIHVGFGLIRLPEGRLSTRAGRVILLEDVIREAIERAKAVLTSRDLSGEEKAEIARKVGIGALKYADLSQHRRKDVVFNWDRMLALDGDSAPYLQYAYTRTRAILRRAGVPKISQMQPALLIAPEEQTLLFDIARFPEVILAAGENYEPHRIANHLYQLARNFSVFYDRIPVLGAESAELRSSRLALVEMVGQVLKIGLGLLGIEVMERM